jgi:hypothetical protein
VARIALGLQDCLYLGNLSAMRDWGHARDYVEVQWLMLQQAAADDFVIATGVQHSVRQFVDLAAAELGITIAWSGSGESEIGSVAQVQGRRARCKPGDVIVRVDPRYYRPTEVQTLLGDATKARDKLGWRPKTTLVELVREMVEADYTAARRDSMVKLAGFQAYDYNELARAGDLPPSRHRDHDARRRARPSAVPRAPRRASGGAVDRRAEPARRPPGGPRSRPRGGVGRAASSRAARDVEHRAPRQDRATGPMESAMNLPCIVPARAVGDFPVGRYVDDGGHGIADPGDLVPQHDAAAPRRDARAFAAFGLDEWPTRVCGGGFDVSAETLSSRATAKPAARAAASATTDPAH